MKKRFTEEQIIGFLREAESGIAVTDLCRRHGYSEANYYLWKSKFGGLSVPEAKRLNALAAENTRLKKLLADDRSLKCLAIMGDCAQESVIIRLDTAISGT